MSPTRHPLLCRQSRKITRDLLQFSTRCPLECLPLLALRPLWCFVPTEVDRKSALSSGAKTAWKSGEQPDRVMCMSPPSRFSRHQLTCSLSVGHHNAIKQILLATYRALSQLPASHLHPELVIPPLSDPTSTNGHSTPLHAPSSPLARPTAVRHHLVNQAELASPYASRPGSPTRTKLSAINVPIFQYVWCGLAGISTPADSKAFATLVKRDLCVSESRIKVTNGQLVDTCRRPS